MSAQKLKELERLYQERYATFRKTLATITGSYETARDATQEAFARAVAAQESFREASSLETWVWRIAIRAAIDIRRKEAAFLRSNGAGVPEAMFVEPECDPALAAAVRALPARSD